MTVYHILLQEHFRAEVSHIPDGFKVSKRAVVLLKQHGIAMTNTELDIQKLKGIASVRFALEEAAKVMHRIVALNQRPDASEQRIVAKLISDTKRLSTQGTPGQIPESR